MKSASRTASKTLYKKKRSNNQRQRMLAALFVLIAVGVGIYIVVFAKASDLAIASVTDLGAVGMPSNVTARDGGISANIGGKLTWVFGDTFYRPTTPLPAGTFKPVSASAGVAPLSNPLAVSGTADSYGVPDQLIPYRDDEPNVGPSERYALWPASIVAEAGGKTGMVFYQQTHITTPRWVSGPTSVARIQAGQTVADRLPLVLFAANEPSFRKPAVVDDTVYLYSACTSMCPVAKVSTSQMANRSAYTFWNGSTWSSDLSQAKGVLPGSAGGYSIAYSAAIKSFVQVFIPYGKHTLYMRTAPAAEGPWGSETKVLDLDPNKTEYVPNFQPALFENNGQVLYVTYSRDLGNFHGDIRLLKVSLAISQTMSASTNSANVPPATTSRGAGELSSTSTTTNIAGSETVNQAPSESESPAAGEAVAASETNPITNPQASSSNWFSPLRILLAASILFLAGGGWYVVKRRQLRSL